MSRGGRREITARKRARELALQGIYQWLLHEFPPEEAREPIKLSLPDQPPQAQLLAIEEILASAPLENDAQDAKKTKPRTPPDAEFFAALLQGAVQEAPEARTIIEPLLTRAVAELSPVEHAILLLAFFELRHGIETPYRVIINEAIELAKKYGGSDGHRFINGVLDRLAGKLRPAEVATKRQQGSLGKGD
ncbi:MAG: transcription antitermination factor NusB [Azoarcus sp.]|jgi:N utilization substance protein B|nr:transcription antitermination factor NusB [Azoarcus sp.]